MIYYHEYLKQMGIFYYLIYPINLILYFILINKIIILEYFSFITIFYFYSLIQIMIALMIKNNLSFRDHYALVYSLEE